MILILRKISKLHLFRAFVSGTNEYIYINVLQAIVYGFG